MTYLEFKKQATVDQPDTLNFHGIGGAEVKMKNPYAPRNIPDPTKAYKPGMTAQEKYDTAQKRIGDAAAKEYGGFFSHLRNTANDFFDEYGVVPLPGVFTPGFNPLAIGTENKVFSNPFGWMKVFKPSSWTKPSYANTPGTRTYNKQQEALSSDRVKKEVDAFVDNTTMQDKSDLMKLTPDGLKPSGNPAKDALVQRGYERMKTNAISQIWENPIKNLPSAASLFLRQYGMNQLADFAENPWGFYGTLAAVLLGGGSLLAGGGSGSNSQPIIINQGGDSRMNKIPYAVG